MATILGERFPMVTLDNKLTVVNYGSNHTYSFVGGKVLDKCTDEICHETHLLADHNGRAQVIVSDADDKVSIDIPKEIHEFWRDYVVKHNPEYKDYKMWLDVFVDYKLNDILINDLNIIAEMDIIDIILVPRILIESLEGCMNNLDNYVLRKIRTCKIADRVSKIIHADRFCGSDMTRYADLGGKHITINDVQVPA